MPQSPRQKKITTDSIKKITPRKHQTRSASLFLSTNPKDDVISEKKKPRTTRKHSVHINGDDTEEAPKVSHSTKKESIDPEFMIKQADKCMQESVDAMVHFEVDAKAAETAKQTVTSLEKSLPQIDALLKDTPNKKHDAKSIPATAQEASMAALMASLAKNLEKQSRTIENQRLRNSEDFRVRMEELADAVKGYGGEARSHGHLAHALRYAPIPNAQKMADPLAHVMATGLALINAAEEHILDPAVSSLINLSVRGAKAYHLQGKVEHQASLD